jgi:hypothetical protein
MTKRLTRPHKKTGRPTEYRTYVSRVFEMCLLGLPDERIAELLGTSRAGLNRWKKEHKAFRDAFERGRNIADGKVAKALYKRALGYSIPQTKTTFDAEGNVTQRIVTPVHFPPDPSALAFYLSNRSRVYWQTKPSQALDLAAGLEQLILAAVERRQKREGKVLEHQPADEAEKTELDWDGRYLACSSPRTLAEIFAGNFWDWFWAVINGRFVINLGGIERVVLLTLGSSSGHYAAHPFVEVGAELVI